MAKAKAETCCDPHPSDCSRASHEMRIDAPHIRVGENAPPESQVPQPEPVLVQSGPSGSASTLAQQVRTHATQLAEHLEARRRELDRREADLNARWAECEAQARNTRLALAQRRAELEDREAEWAGQRREAEADLQHCHVSWEREYQERVAALEKKESAFADELEARRRAFEDELQRRLAAVEKEIQERKAASAPAGDAMDRRAADCSGSSAADADEHRAAQNDLAAREEQLQKREDDLRRHSQQIECLRLQVDQTNRQMLEALEKRRLAVEEQAARLQDLQQQLLADRGKWQEELQTERQLLAAHRRREMDELEQKRLALRRRGEQLDRSRVALQQTREDLRRVHRETLEIRLASEELWVQLSETAPAAVANRLLEQLRAKLAEQYRLASAELAQQKEDLLSLRAELAEVHQKIAHDRRDLQQWADRRQAELNGKAAELDSREKQLDRQEGDLLTRSLQWRSQSPERPRAALRRDLESA
jgi:hypothetical protein